MLAAVVCGAVWWCGGVVVVVSGGVWWWCVVVVWGGADREEKCALPHGLGHSAKTLLKSRLVHKGVSVSQLLALCRLI